MADNNNIDGADTNNSSDERRYTGTVKWFNNKNGYGFITVCDDGEFGNTDIFVHYSSIRNAKDDYKYLLQGEYVEFVLAPASTETHAHQAMDVTGVRGGPIMCEIRRHPRVRPERGMDYDSPVRDRPAYRERPATNTSGGGYYKKRDTTDDGYQVVKKRRRPAANNAPKA